MKKPPKSVIDAAIAQHYQELTSAGGKARAKKLTRKRRIEIATKASAAAAKARKKRGKAKE
jgi:hypothetical protein